MDDKGNWHNAEPEGQASTAIADPPSRPVLHVSRGDTVRIVRGDGSEGFEAIFESAVKNRVTLKPATGAPLMPLRFNERLQLQFVDRLLVKAVVTAKFMELKDGRIIVKSMPQ